MKHLTIYIITPLVLALIFLAASCEIDSENAKTKVGTLVSSCENGLCIYSMLHDGHRYVFTYNGGIIHHPDCMASDTSKWHKEVTMKNLTIERLNYSLQDLSQEIEERDREITKLKERLKECE